MGEMTVQLSLAVTEARRVEKAWSVKVAVTFTNDGSKPFALDRVTICDGGEVANQVFEVKRGGEEIAYLGMMAKRAPPGPDGFLSSRPKRHSSFRCSRCASSGLESEWRSSSRLPFEIAKERWPRSRPSPLVRFAACSESRTSSR
jgi:hypothetical protein